MTAVGYLGDVALASLAAETAARVAADSTLTGLITAEAASRASGVTAAQAAAVQRVNHTGVQAISTVTGLQTALDAKPDKSTLPINVKDAPYGALGNDSANDTAAFLAAVTAAGSTRNIYVPPGTYRVDPDVIVLATAIRLFGGFSDNTVIKSRSVTKTGAGVTLTAPGAGVSGLTIRGFYAGIDNQVWWTRIYNNWLTANTIGIDFSLDSYLVRVRGNFVTFNDGVGILVRSAAQAYELVITENIIDNNNGVGIAIASASAGLVIENNSIEGNRKYTTNVGCGILVKGTNVSRLKIHGNWFEVNGSDATSAVDIFLLCPASEPATPAALRTAIVGVLPADLQSLFATGGVNVGAISITDNSFVFTKYSVIAAGYKSAITIAENNFKGVLDRNNRHVFLSVPAGTGGMGGSRVNIEGNNYRNSDDATIDTQVTGGIANSIVFSDSVLSGTGDVFLYDGAQLFGAFTGEKVYPVTFTATANEKADLYFSNSAGNLFATFEITLVGFFQGANAAGVVKTVYSLGGSSAGTVYENDSTTLVAQGTVRDHFGLTAASWDAGNSRWKITLAHRTSTANAVSMRVRWQAQSAVQSAAIRDSIGVSAVYTTDTSTVAAPAVSTIGVPRVTTTTSSATPTPNVATTDVYDLSALAAPATFGAPTGSPADGQSLLIRVKDDGTGRALTWNVIYRAVGTVIPATTVAGKMLYVGCRYNAAAAKWDVLAVGSE